MKREKSLWNWETVVYGLNNKKCNIFMAFISSIYKATTVKKKKNFFEKKEENFWKILLKMLPESFIVVLIRTNYFQNEPQICNISFFSRFHQYFIWHSDFISASVLPNMFLMSLYTEICMLHIHECDFDTWFDWRERESQENWIPIL